MQLTYPSGQGPGAVTTTARRGDTDGGSNQPPHGGVFNVQNNPFVVANGHAGDILNSFDFTYNDGTTTGVLGGSGHVLSSIHINGISDYYGTNAEVIEVPFGWTTTT